MSYNSKAIKTDVNAKPIPQYYNPVTDEYEVLQGTNGAARQVLYGPNGQPISIVDNKLAVKAAELEAKIEALNAKLDGVIDGTTPAKTEAQLTGSMLADEEALPIRSRGIEEITLFNAVAVADTALHTSPLVNFKKYEKVVIIATTTLKENIDLWFLIGGKWAYTLKSDGTWTRDNFSKITIPKQEGTYVWQPELQNNGSSFFYMQASVAPTSGSITVKLWGVPR